MPLLNHEIVGTIAISPASALADSRTRVSDETTLGDLLIALATCPATAGGDSHPRRIVASTRISRFAHEEAADCNVLRADVSCLAVQLAQEYAEVVGT
jgi:hypothetical protein